MAQSFSGWAPPDRIRRSVVLPIGLDERIASYAIEQDSTPSTVLSDTLRRAVSEACHKDKDFVHAQAQSANDYVERAVVLESSVNEALDECIYTLRFGRNGDSADVDFSDLVVALLDRYLQTNGNGSSSGL